MPKIVEISLAALVICANVAPLAIMKPVEQPNGVRQAASLLGKKHLDGRMSPQLGKIDRPVWNAQPSAIR